MTEADLADLGIFRVPVPVPFPQAGGPVNLYVIEEAGGGVLMFDAGLGSDPGKAAIEEGFGRLGRRFEEVTRIVVSHGHVDHFGAARWIQERHGGELPVYAHPADQPKITEAGPRMSELAPRYGAYLARLGVPPDVLAAIAADGLRTSGYSKRLARVSSLGEGDVVRTKHLALEILHMPGHTPGLLCAYDRARRLILSDDHLLEKVSPNPLIELGPDGGPGTFKPLVAYLKSITRMRALDLDLVLPGHGAPFADHRGVIDRLVGFYGKRHAKLLERIGDGAPTVYEVARDLFPRARNGEVFLTVSEVIANLEVLEERGEVRREDDGTVRFRRA